MEALLRMALDLVDVMVLSGLLKTSLVEARMKMEMGGLLRQALRLGLYFLVQLINISFELKLLIFMLLLLAMRSAQRPLFGCLYLPSQF